MDPSIRRYRERGEFAFRWEVGGAKKAFLKGFAEVSRLRERDA
jgi:hypothetical protein